MNNFSILDSTTDMRELNITELECIHGGALDGRKAAAAMAAGFVTGGITGSMVGGIGAVPGAVGGALLGGIAYAVSDIVESWL